MFEGIQFTKSKLVEGSNLGWEVLFKSHSSKFSPRHHFTGMPVAEYYSHTVGFALLKTNASFSILSNFIAKGWLNVYQNHRGIYR